MTNYILDGHDLSALFDTSISPISFSENPSKHIPNKGSIIYLVWDKKENFIYIGISRLQKSLRNTVLFQEWFLTHLVEEVVTSYVSTSTISM